MKDKLKAVILGTALALLAIVAMLALTHGIRSA